MGLSVILHENVSHVSQCVDDLNCFLAHVINEQFESNISQLKKGEYYVSEKRTRSISYPYSYHAEFRSHLCVLIGLKYDYWRENKDPGNCFHELLFFADNEGCIDWKTSRKLAADFINNEVKAMLSDNARFKEFYKEWMDLLLVASNEGNVIEFT